MKKSGVTKKKMIRLQKINSWDELSSKAKVYINDEFVSKWEIADSDRSVIKLFPPPSISLLFANCSVSIETMKGDVEIFCQK